MTTMEELSTPIRITWCPGCGNFAILTAVKRAIVGLGLRREEVVAVTGIGCHGRMTNYINVNGIHVLHGRVLPVATAIKLANHRLTILGFAGDGDAYSIGMGHLSHTARRNADVKYIVHNNLVYALTTGQTSPTSELGFRTRSTPRGSYEQPINPLLQALSSGASFVARGFAGDLRHLTMLLKEAVRHRGFALIDVLQPCMVWNRVNTYEWYRERVYRLEAEGHNPQDLEEAFRRAVEWGDRIPIGILYSEERPTFEEYFPLLRRGPLALQPFEMADLTPLLRELT